MKDFLSVSELSLATSGTATLESAILECPCAKPSVEDLRYSYGVGVTWITQLGPMSLALSSPTNQGPLDETENFQFEIGMKVSKIQSWLIKNLILMQP